MKQSSQIQTAIAVDHSRFMDYISLTKPELTFLSVLTALTGYLLASDGRISPLLLATALVGTALVGGGAGALNQFIERRWDALMRRTEHRPLPAGRLTPLEAATFGIVSSLLGLSCLAAFNGVTTTLLAAITLGSYLFVYTPMKRVSPLATIVGAVPGALPPVMGWTAAGREIDSTAFFLFAILVLWQIPHFLSLGWMYRHDSARAGYKLVSAVDHDGRRTARESLGFMSAIMLVIGLPCLTGYFGILYMAGSLVISGAFIVTGWIHLLEKSNKSARMMFIASLIYLPTLMGLMVIDRLLLIP